MYIYSIHISRKREVPKIHRYTSPAQQITSGITNGSLKSLRHSRIAPAKGMAHCMQKHVEYTSHRIQNAHTSGAELFSEVAQISGRIFTRHWLPTQKIWGFFLGPCHQQMKIFKWSATKSETMKKAWMVAAFFQHENVWSILKFSKKHTRAATKRSPGSQSASCRPAKTVDNIWHQNIYIPA